MNGDGFVLVGCVILVGAICAYFGYLAGRGDERDAGQ